jgi:uncharacterized protein (DUF58 family)
MNLYPTATTRLLVSAAAVAVIAAALQKMPIVIIWMGSILIGMTIVRAIASFKVAVARHQGFEMLLASGTRRYSITRTESFELDVVLRNRSAIALQVRDVRVLASPILNVHVSVEEAPIGPHGSLNIRLTGEANRVGHCAVHGLFLRVLHTSGAFEAPLVFFNPVQFIVYPTTAPRSARPSRGGLSRLPSDADRAGRMSGDSIELRELRAHQPGDALRKIAWKASAKRGTLLVRDEELMERQTLWVLLDASAELWAGELGRAPLDEGLDRVASVLHKYISLGDRVGLGVLSSRTLAWFTPESGLPQWARLRDGLLQSLQLWDADRSGSDERDVARIVLEHLSRLEPAAAHPVGISHIEAIANAATRVAQRYEFELPNASARHDRERSLRQYAAAFGLTGSPRLEAERRNTDNQLLSAIDRCVADKPSRIILCSVEPTESLLEGIANQQRRLGRRRIKLSWLGLNTLAGMPESNTSLQLAANDSIRWHFESARLGSSGRLRRVGIGIEPLPIQRRQIGRGDNP